MRATDRYAALNRRARHDYLIEDTLEAGLVLHGTQMSRLMGAVRREGVTIVPLALYFNERGRAKVELGLATGKRKADKRQAERDRDWQRSRARIMRSRDL